MQPKHKSAKEIDSSATSHNPVMLAEVMNCLEPVEGHLVIDGTFGAGGYSSALLANGAHVLGIDRDKHVEPFVHDLTNKYKTRFHFRFGEFAEMGKIWGEQDLPQPNGVVLDIGVSSMQLDQASRGFSFQNEGPLDMRMSQSGFSAADLVNRADHSDLTRIIGILGEERRAAAIASAIIRKRASEAIKTTGELVTIIESVLGRKKPGHIHPATRTFQALRIFINRELDQLMHGLSAAERVLKAGGRLVVVTFHSLEDRIVKQFFADRSKAPSVGRHMPAIQAPAPTFDVKGRGLIKPSDSEISTNSRARSAKLRWATRTLEQPRSFKDYFNREIAPTLTREIFT